MHKLVIKIIVQIYRRDINHRRKLKREHLKKNLYMKNHIVAELMEKHSNMLSNLL